MKKKYIIALEDRNVWSCGVPAKTLLLSDVSIFGTDLSSVNTGIELTPYTEPDLEQVKKDYDAFYEHGHEQGLADAWDAARKIIHMPEGDLLNIFTECYSAVCTALQVLLKYDASEVIEKIRQYEQEKDRQARIEYNFDEIKDVLETTVKECNVSLDEIAAVLQKMREE